MEKGLESASHTFTINMLRQALRKFPNLDDKELAELVGVTELFVQKVRKELTLS
jgi:hypothetical protein